MNKTIAAGLVFAILAVMTAAAQDAAPADTTSERQEIEELKQRIEELDQKLRVAERKQEIKQEEAAAKAKVIPTWERSCRRLRRA